MAANLIQDIIEGVNFMDRNLYTLHTEKSRECIVDRYLNQTGVDANTNNCGVSFRCALYKFELKVFDRYYRVTK
jgi:hypothetical protein